MDEVVEEIIVNVMKRVGSYDYQDQHWMYTEIADALRKEADFALQMGNFNSPIE